MYSPEIIQTIFENNGGIFMTPAPRIAKKLENIKAFLFDWDGVFNSGKKGVEFTSTYSETDVLGINLLRFSFYLRFNTIPFLAIVTNLVNESALQLAKREYFNAVYVSVKNKRDALNHIQETYNIRPSQIAFVMDDVLDLPAAELTGLSFMVGRKASPLFNEYVRKNELVDYITYQRGDLNVVREICELIMGLNGNFVQTIEERMKYSESFETFTTLKEDIEAKFYHKVDKKIIETII
jgi:3-deoxy-D-manno-octulosonate 8-phosphate phosphatase (KDO 8-P phosphatase)